MAWHVRTKSFINLSHEEKIVMKKKFMSLFCSVSMLSVVFFCLGLNGTSQATPLFDNHSFENYTGDSTSPYTDLDDDVDLIGWEANNANNRLDVFSSNGYNASDGSTALRVHPTIDGAFQQIVSGFEINGKYTLTFDMAASGIWHDNTNNSNDSYWSNQSLSGQGIKVVVDGTQIGTAQTNAAFDASVDFGSEPFVYYTYSIDFTAISTDLTFQFDIFDPNAEGGVALDNLLLSGPAPVPEPATMLLFGLGLLGLAGVSRKKQ